MKKRRLVVLSLAVCIWLTVGALTMRPPRPGVNKANFDRIQIGMTLDEVEQILGRPKDERWTRDFVWVGDKDAEGIPEAYIYIDFTDGLVTHKDARFWPPPRSLSNILRRWIGVNSSSEKKESILK